MSGYDHKQICPLALGVLAVGLACAVLATVLVVWGEGWELGMVVGLAWGMFVFGTLFAIMFLYQHVSDQGDRLRVEFGPLGVVHVSADYEEMESVGRTTVSRLARWQVRDGRPVRIYAARKGEAVQIELKKPPEVRLPRALIIGTDDVESLLEFLQTKTQQRSRP